AASPAPGRTSPALAVVTVILRQRPVIVASLGSAPLPMPPMSHPRPHWRFRATGSRLSGAAAPCVPLGGQPGRGSPAPGLFEQFGDAVRGRGRDTDAQPAEPLAPQQGLEGGRVLGHRRVDLALVDEYVQVLVDRRNRGEDLAARAERGHVEVWFLGCGRER